MWRMTCTGRDSGPDGTHPPERAGFCSPGPAVQRRLCRSVLRCGSNLNEGPCECSGAPDGSESLRLSGRPCGTGSRVTNLESTLPLPKRRHSATRRDKRRTHYKIAAPTLTTCPSCGGRLSHTACKACGQMPQAAGDSRGKARQSKGIDAPRGCGFVWFGPDEGDGRPGDRRRGCWVAITLPERYCWVRWKAPPGTMRASWLSVTGRSLSAICANERRGAPSDY